MKRRVQALHNYAQFVGFPWCFVGSGDPVGTMDPSKKLRAFCNVRELHEKFLLLDLREQRHFLDVYWHLALDKRKRTEVACLISRRLNKRTIKFIACQAKRRNPRVLVKPPQHPQHYHNPTVGMTFVLV